jgi:hypothetical protein
MDIQEIQAKIVECSRKVLEFKELRKHYARMVRRERERRKALLALLDKEEARRGAAGGVREVKRDPRSVPQGGGQGKPDLAADFEDMVRRLADRWRPDYLKKGGAR